LVEEYFQAVQEWPDGWQLQRLANEILREELKDKKKNKTHIKEYPILSDRQMERRMEMEVSVPEVLGTSNGQAVGRKNISVEGKNGGIYTKKQKVYSFNL